MASGPPEQDPMARRERREGDRGARPPCRPPRRAGAPTLPPAAPAARAWRGCPTSAGGGAARRWAMHGRRQATGRDAIYEETLQTRSHADHTRGQLPPHRPPEAADYLNLPPVAGCRRCEAPERPAASCTGATGRSRSRTQWRPSRTAGGRARRRWYTATTARSQTDGGRSWFILIWTTFARHMR